MSISAEVIKKIRRIELRAGHLVDDAFSGGYLSAIKGQGMEFEDVRAYVPGDDVRRIDWKVTARLGQTQIKQFREEREMVVYLLIDVSASGLFGSVDVDRSERLAELAAALAFCTTRNNDKVGVLFFSDDVEKHIPPGSGQAHIFRLIREILTHEPRQVRQTRLMPVAERLIHLRKRKTVVFLLSDLWTPDFEKATERLAARHTLSVFWMRDRLELSWPTAGLLPVVDAETGESAWIDLSSATKRQRFAEEMQRRDESISGHFRRNKVGLARLMNDEAYLDQVISFFRGQKGRAR